MHHLDLDTCTHKQKAKQHMFVIFIYMQNSKFSPYQHNVQLTPTP